MPNVTVKRRGDTVEVVVRESVRDMIANDDSTWTLKHEDDQASMFNVWTLRIPANEAGVLLKGLIEAGVEQKPRDPWLGCAGWGGGDNDNSGED